MCASDFVVLQTITDYRLNWQISAARCVYTKYIHTFFVFSSVSHAVQTFSIRFTIPFDVYLMVSNVVRLIFFPAIFPVSDLSWWTTVRLLHPFSFFFFSVCFRKGLYISDVPIHDATRDLVLLSEQFEAGYKLTRNLEVLTDKLQQTYRELESEKQKTDR